MTTPAPFRGWLAAHSPALGLIVLTLAMPSVVLGGTLLFEDHVSAIGLWRGSASAAQLPGVLLPPFWPWGSSCPLPNSNRLGIGSRHPRRGVLFSPKNAGPGLAPRCFWSGSGPCVGNGRELLGHGSVPLPFRKYGDSLSGRITRPSNNALHQTRRGGVPAARAVVEARLAGERKC